MTTDALWYGGAALLAIIGVPLFLWALFYDKNKNQRRCPKCSYQLVGDEVTTCPECGRAIRNEKELYRVHRRWKWAALAIVLAVASFGLSQIPSIQRDGWWSIVPTSFIISTLDDVDDPVPLLSELSSRQTSGDLTDEECRTIAAFIVEARVVATDPARIASLMRFVTPYGELQRQYDIVLVQRFKFASGSERNNYIPLLMDRPSHGGNSEVLTIAVSLLDDPDISEYGVINLIAHFGSPFPEARDVLIKRFGANPDWLDIHIFRALVQMRASDFVWDTTTGGTPRERRIALSTVDDNDLRMYEDKDTIISILWDATRSYDPQLREAAYESLCRFTGRGEAFDRVVAVGLLDDEPNVRFVVAKTLRKSPFPRIAERGEAELTALSQSGPDEHVRRLAIVYLLDEVPVMALDDFIEKNLDLNDPIVRSAIAMSLGRRFRSERDEKLIERIVELADDEDAFVRRMVVRALAIAPDLPPEAMQAYEKLMHDPDAEVRKAAEEGRQFLQPRLP